MNMHRCTILSQRLAPRINRFYGSTNKRFKTSSSSNPNANADAFEQQQKNLKWTERKEAPKWLLRMVPSKGGTSLPTPIEAAVIAVVAAAGYWSWFGDHEPKSVEEGGATASIEAGK